MTCEQVNEEGEWCDAMNVMWWYGCDVMNVMWCVGCDAIPWYGYDGWMHCDECDLWCDRSIT